MHGTFHTPMLISHDIIIIKHSNRVSQGFLDFFFQKKLSYSLQQMFVILCRYSMQATRILMLQMPVMPCWMKPERRRYSRMYSRHTLANLWMLLTVSTYTCFDIGRSAIYLHNHVIWNNLNNDNWSYLWIVREWHKFQGLCSFKKRRP